MRFGAEEEAASGDLEADAEESCGESPGGKQGGRLHGETAEAALERPAVSLSETMQELQTERAQRRLGFRGAGRCGGWGLGLETCLQGDLSVQTGPWEETVRADNPEQALTVCCVLSVYTMCNPHVSSMM